MNETSPQPQHSLSLLARRRATSYLLAPETESQFTVTARVLRVRLRVMGWSWLWAACLSALVGCQSFATKWDGDLWGGSEKPELPEEIVAIWTDTVLHQPQQPGIRGFGGRVYFYAKPDDDPIEVDGTLTVYVFDAAHKNPDQERPRKKYVITPDQLAKHHSKTKIGHSYSVWIPWDKVGGPSIQLSLVARFDGRDGGTVVSSASDKLLPGVLAPINPADSANSTASALAASRGSASTMSAEGGAAPASSNLNSASAPLGGGFSSTRGSATVQAAGFAGRNLSSPTVTPAVGMPAGTTNELLPTFDIELPPSFQQRLRQAPATIEGPSSTAVNAAPAQPPHSASPAGSARAWPAPSSPAANQGAQSQGAQNQGAQNQGALSSRDAAQNAAAELTGGDVSTLSDNDTYVGGPASEGGMSVAAGNASPVDSAAGTRLGSRSAPARFPARREPRVQPVRDPLRRLPHPAGWPSELPRTPRAD